MNDSPDDGKLTGMTASDRIYTGRVINLDLDTVRFPDGSLGKLEIIRHPGASAIVPILDDPQVSDPRVVLIRQYRYAAGGYLYEIPAGRLDVGESPSDCAARELVEETGYRAARIDHLYTMFTTPGFTDERIHVFRATGLHEGTTARESDEFMSLEPMALSRAMELIRTGEISDAKTALAILYVAQFGLSGRIQKTI
ncbi:MAG: NUDIX hydrolase [Gemmatimonadaceae bacterium]